MDIDRINSIILKGESETMEFKKSTASLREVGMTLCAFLNNAGGKVIVGISPAKKLVGQIVTDKTQQAIAQTLSRIEPHGSIKFAQVFLQDSNKALLLFEAVPSEEGKPYVYDARPYQ